MNYLILTEQQADDLRGIYNVNYMIDPIRLNNNEYILPIDLIENIEFTEVKNTLESLPQREVLSTEFN